MWLCVPFGILMPAIRPPHTVAKGDDRTMQIRSRRKQDLDILRAEWMQGTLGRSIHTPGMDYEYRAYCTPAAFALTIAKMIEKIDYLKFKPTTDRYEDQDLHSCYNRMWGVVMDELSTKQHRYDYQYSGKNWSAKGGKGPGKGSGKTGTTYASSSYTGTGWSQGARDIDAPVTLGPRAADASQSMDVYLGLASGAAGARDTRADRDEYTLDPAVQVEDLDDDDLRQEENDLVDALYRQIDDILDEQKATGPVDHSACEHPASDNARARCRRRRRKEQAKRICEIRELIEDSRRDARSTGTVLVGEVVA
jgi:hypothetical protein